MRDAGHADVPVVLQVTGNKADAEPRERLPSICSFFCRIHARRAADEAKLRVNEKRTF
jgi:hypothetical protein